MHVSKFLIEDGWLINKALGGVIRGFLKALRFTKGLREKQVHKYEKYSQRNRQK